MAKEGSVIETGVDKLVALIRAKGRISGPEAAKALGVGAVVVEEWADFLEEEGIISIEYKFATPYLVERKLTKDEVKSKEKEVEGKKEGFIRKAEVALAVIDKESENFERFKDNFEKLKKELGSDLQSVEKQFKQLEKYESLKSGVDKQIMEHENAFKDKIDAYKKDIAREQQKYLVVIESLNTEEEKLDKERVDTLSLREKELGLRQKIAQFQDVLLKLDKGIKDQEGMIEISDKKIGELKKWAEKIKQDILKKKEAGDDLMKEGEEHKQKIEILQKEIIDKVSKGSKEISKQVEDSRVSTKKFKEFFNKKADMDDMIKEMTKEHTELEAQLIALVKKAKAFHLSTNSAGFKSHVKELEDAFEQVKKKKEKFEKGISKIGSFTGK